MSAAKLTRKELREESAQRAKQILEEYAVRTESQGQDAALRWLEAEAHSLIDAALSKDNPMGAVQAFETLLTIAEI